MSTTMAVRDPARASMAQPIASGWVIGISLVILAAFIPLMFAHFQQLWLKPHYQLFPVVIGLAFVLVWPLNHFAYSKAPGAMAYAIAMAIGGAVLVLFGMLIDSSEGLAFLGGPSAWVAAGAVTLVAAIPVTIFTGLGCSQASYGNPAKGMIGAFTCWLLLAVAVFFNSPAAATALAIVMTGALAMTIGGWPLLRRCLPVLLYLFLIVPPPFMMDTILVQQLQLYAARISSKLLDMMGVYHHLKGVVIDVGTPPLLGIVDACSGISSLLTTLACVLFYVIYFRVHWLRGTLLTLMSMMWVMANNSLRIIGIAYFRVKWNIDLSSGVPHFIYGILLFCLTLLLIWSSDRLLMFFGRSAPTKRRFEPTTLTQETARSGLVRLLSLDGAFYLSKPIAVLFCVVVALQVAAMIAERSRVPYAGSALSKVYDKIEVDLLPKQAGIWERDDKLYSEKREAGNPLGEFSKFWIYYRKPGTARCNISLDYPYPEYHDLRVCYSNIGWTVLEPKTFAHSTKDGLTDLHCVKVALVRPVEQYGYLWFCEFDQDGVGQNPITDSISPETIPERISTRITFEFARWQRLFFATKTPASSGLGSILQVQLLFLSNEEKTQAEQDILQSLFVQSAERIRAKCVELKSGGK